MSSDSGTPIFDEVVNWFSMLPQEAPFQHAGGQSCRGCQICLSEAHDIDSDPDGLPEG
jgi:hypothetical protein